MTEFRRNGQAALAGATWPAAMQIDTQGETPNAEFARPRRACRRNDGPNYRTDFFSSTGTALRQFR
jgi:hypothetical protein